MIEDPAPTTTIPLESVQALRQELTGLFEVGHTAIDWPQPGQVRFRGRFICDPADCYDHLRERFERHGFTPVVRDEEDTAIEGRVALIAVPVIYDPPPSNPLINLVLFVITVLFTLVAGTLMEPDAQIHELWRGIPFSLSLLLILGAHELGHYFAARYHNVAVTLPYFIPFPNPLIGTMGAFIRLKAPVKNRRALLDIGAAGPLAGLVFAIPILLYGLATSPVQMVGNVGIREGNSILYALAKLLVFQEWLPNTTTGMDVLLNQVAWAGWLGLLITGLNLIPVGQLDGGHVSYVLFRERARRFFWPVVGLLILLTALTGTFTWVLWIGLLFLFGRSYAEPLDSVTPLDPARRAIAIFTLVLFFLVFVPIPLQAFGP